MHGVVVSLCFEVCHEGDVVVLEGWFSLKVKYKTSAKYSVKLVRKKMW